MFSWDYLSSLFLSVLFIKILSPISVDLLWEKKLWITAARWQRKATKEESNFNFPKAKQSLMTLKHWASKSFIHRRHKLQGADRRIMEGLLFFPHSFLKIEKMTAGREQTQGNHRDIKGRVDEGALQSRAVGDIFLFRAQLPCAVWEESWGESSTGSFRGAKMEPSITGGDGGVILGRKKSTLKWDGLRWSCLVKCLIIIFLRLQTKTDHILILSACWTGAKSQLFFPNEMNTVCICLFEQNDTVMIHM